MKSTRRFRAWLATRTGCTFAGLALSGAGEAWLCTHFLSNWSRQMKPALLQPQPVTAAPHHFPQP